MEKREPVLSMRDLAVSFQASFGKIRAVRGVNMTYILEKPLPL